MRETLPTPTLRLSVDSTAPSSLDVVRVAPMRRPGKVLRSTSEPGGLTLLTDLVNPTAIVVTLFLSVLIYGHRLTPPYLALAALAFILSFHIISRPDFSRSHASGIVNIIQHRVFTEWMLVSAALLLLAFALKVTEEFSRRVILSWFVMAPFAVVGAQELLRRFAAFAAMRGSIAQSHIIVGANAIGRRLAQRLQASPHRGTFKGFFDDRDGSRLAGIPDEQLLGSMADIADYVRVNQVSCIYICLPIRAERRVMQLMKELRDTTASVYFVPDIFVFDLIQAQFTEIDGIPLVAVCETPFRGMNAALKRASDILMASALLALIWPLMLAIAIGVRRSSPGPVIFKQRRYGLYGEPINVYKFRTMTVCEKDGPIRQATRNDPRVTRFGAFLRRTSLDELPQLFNVLLGTMSMVGPRPHVVHQNEEYRKVIDGYMRRHKVRPGITGWAQVNGLRGETDTVEKMKRRVEFDIEYLRNWSLGLDLRILLRTAALVWRDRNAY
jgi:putative colanic acid biosynthesis UDP-glucose lipid carrier transferase